MADVEEVKFSCGHSVITGGSLSDPHGLASKTRVLFESGKSCPACERKQPIIKVTPEEWDAQYLTGQWDYLKGVTAHYAVIGSLVSKYRCRCVIDVGCGECLIAPYLDSVGYTGIDISLQAFHSVRNRGLIHGDASTFEAERPPWDSAIFCESLYYMPDPLDVLARYFQFCKIIFLSIMVSDKTAELVRSIKERFTVIEYCHVVIREEKINGAWEIMAVKP